MNILCLDFETYYADIYTLSKLSTEEYIRDPRFHAQMVGLEWVSGPLAGRKAVVPPSELHRVNWATTAVICHHAQFDGFILSHHYGIRPAFWFDTLSMARLVLPHAKSHSLGKLAEFFALPAKQFSTLDSVKNTRDLSPEQFARLATYCAHDVELTVATFRRLLPHVPREELRIIDATVRMFTEPCLELDSPRLAAHLDAVKAQKEALLAHCGADRAALQSPAVFAELLRSVGCEPPMKASPTNPTRPCGCVETPLLAASPCPDCGGTQKVPNLIYALAKTDDGFKALIDHEDERVQALASARAGVRSTITETRCERLLATAQRGPLPVYLNYAGAHTLRWSGGDKMNWQNLPRIGFKDGKPAAGPGEKGEIRQSVLAPVGHVLVVGDCSQIECRMLNWLAGEDWVLDAFRNSRDLYSEVATNVYGRPITKRDKLERHLGKTLELGAGFGMGPAKFQVTCRGGALGGPPIILSDDEAKGAIRTYRTTHPRVVELWKRADHMLYELFEGGRPSIVGPMEVRNHRIYGPGGSWLDYTNLSWDDEDRQFVTTDRYGKKAKIYGGKLTENFVQWLSRVVLAQALLRVQDAGLRVVTSTHDEVVCLVPERDAPAALELVLGELRRPPVWAPDIPLDAEGGFARSYSK